MEIFDGEIIFQEHSSAKSLARQLVMASQMKVYQEGNKPTVAKIQLTAEKAANRFLAEVLAAIEEEITILHQVAVKD